MPVSRAHDVTLGGRGFLLAVRPPGGRAWHRTGQSDAPSRRSATDTQYGVLPDEVDHPEVWDDWSGGAFHPYRRQGENTYHWSEGFDARFPRQLVHAQNFRLIDAAQGASTNVNCQGFLDMPWTPAEAQDIPWPSVFAYGYQWRTNYQPVATGSISRAYGLGIMVGSGNYVGRAALAGSYAYLGDAAGSGFLRIGRDATGTVAAGLRAYCFGMAGNQLWRAGGADPVGAFLLQHTTAGLETFSASNWTATIAIGNGRYAVQDMVSLDEQVFAGMPDGMYAGDTSGTFINVVAELANEYHPDNCRDLAVHDGQVVTQHVGGVYAYRPTGYAAEVRHIGPPTSVLRSSPVRGMIRCLRSFGGWLYGGLWTGSASHLLAARQNPSDGTYLWHTMQKLPHVAKVHRLHFDGISVASGGQNRIPNRLWAATDISINTGGTAPIYWQEVPAENGNPLALDPVFSPNYVGSARLDLGEVDWSAPGTPKLWRAVELWSEKLASGAQWCQLYYTVDGGSRTLLGTSAKSPKDVLYFPSGAGSFVTGQAIALSLESFTASPAISPIYRSIVLRGALRPKQVARITAVIAIADNLANRQGTPMRSAAAQINDLRGMVATGAPTLCIDPTGAESWVLPVSLDEQEIYQQGDRPPEYQAILGLVAADYTGSGT